MSARTPRRRQVQVLQVPDCPLVDRMLALVEEARVEAGIELDVEVRVGQYPSPTLVIDGLDVASGLPASTTACCRFDLPTREQVIAALRRGA